MRDTQPAGSWTRRSPSPNSSPRLTPERSPAIIRKSFTGPTRLVIDELGYFSRPAEGCIGAVPSRQPALPQDVYRDHYESARRSLGRDLGRYHRRCCGARPAPPPHGRVRRTTPCDTRHKLAPVRPRDLGNFDERDRGISLSAVKTCGTSVWCRFDSRSASGTLPESYGFSRYLTNFPGSRIRADLETLVKCKRPESFAV